MRYTVEVRVWDETFVELVDATSAGEAELVARGRHAGADVAWVRTVKAVAA